ncbi:MAG: TlpA disulfide reductase family protein [Mucilaginibacter sp.]
MKTVYTIIALVLLTGCQFQNIEITGIAPGMDGATVSIVGTNDKTIYGANVQSGKFKIEQQVLNESGYYNLEISKPGARGSKYKIYLEPGKYNLELSADKKEIYPVIHSSSKIQNDLSQYLRFTDSVLYKINNEVIVWTQKMNDPRAALLPDAEYQAIITHLKHAQDEALKAAPSTLDQFASKYPKNEAIAHAMNNMSMESKAAAYYKIFQKLDPAVKNSDDGKKVGQKLNILVNLSPGSMAPGFYGETPDGKKVNVKDLHKKIVLVEFWRSGSIKNRENHQNMLGSLLPGIQGDALGIISVSFDTDKNDWVTAIKKDKINWPQVCDLKGDDSPNAKNWNVTELPTYYLLDGQGRIIYADIYYSELPVSINQYLAKH